MNPAQLVRTAYNLLLSVACLIALYDRPVYAEARSTPAYERTLDDDVYVLASVRDDDTRYLREDTTGTVSLICTGNDGRLTLCGSAAIIEGGFIVSAIHTLVDVYSCQPKVDTASCFIATATHRVTVTWARNPSAECETNSQRRSQSRGDGIVVGSLGKTASTLPAYKVLCRDSLHRVSDDMVLVSGAHALNSSLKAAPSHTALHRPGTIVSQGRVYSLYKDQIRYDNDTGPGTSGGAITIMVGADEYLIGVHSGDVVDGLADGAPADIHNNHGIGFLLDAKRLGISCHGLPTDQ